MIDASIPRAGNTDWIRAVNDYDAMVERGEVTFDAEGFADEYPNKSDASIRVWVEHNVPDEI